MIYDNLLGEFIGTMVLIVFGGGVCACNTLAKSKGQGGGWICITTAWGFCRNARRLYGDDAGGTAR